MKEKNILFLLIISIHLLPFYKSEDCPKDRPIKYNNGECQIRKCSQEEFQNRSCIISNEIVKIQWINNIIRNVDQETNILRVVTSNQGLFLSSYYDIDDGNDGDDEINKLLIYNFNDNNKELILNEISTTNVYIPLYHIMTHESLLTKINNSVDNYLLSCIFTICDLVNYDNHEIQTFDVFDPDVLSILQTHNNAFFKLNDNYNYFYGMISINYETSESRFLIMSKFHFNFNEMTNSFDIEYYNKYLDSSSSYELEQNSLSCFQTEKNIIECLVIDTSHQLKIFILD